MKVTVYPQNVTVKIETEKSLYDGCGLHGCGLPDGLGLELDDLSGSWDCDTNVFYFYDVEPDEADMLAERATEMLAKYL